MVDDPLGSGQEVTYQSDAPLVLDASAERWFLLREPVPFGFEMFFIKNHAVSARYSAGMDWTPSVPLWHMGGVRAVLVDVRNRSVACDLPAELLTRDEQPIKLEAAVHFRVTEPARVALASRDPLAEIIARARARLVVVTSSASAADLNERGAAVFTDDTAPLEAGLSELGAGFRQLDVVVLSVPGQEQQKPAEATGRDAGSESPQEGQPPARSTTWCLVNLATQTVHPLNTEITVIGRGAGRASQPNDIRLFDEYASRQHLQITTSGADVVATNLSSVNAVVVNDLKSLGPGEQTKLQAGDVVEVGYTRLKLIEQ